ncbi:MAG: hypothetical protein WC916_00880 [Candidatus Woesearchaeota archaeon]
MSQIIFLGSGSDYQSMQKGRSAGGILLVNEQKILINPGIGSIIQLAKLQAKIEELDFILATEEDDIYTNDAAYLQKISHARFITPKNPEPKKDIIFIQTKLDSLAFKIKTHKYMLTYFTTITYTKKLAEELKDTNIIISEYSSREHTLSKEQIVELVQQINPELYILTNFTHDVKDPLEVTREIKRLLQEKNIPFKTQILAAKDDMIINPESYNIKLKQKSLNQF